MSVEFIKNSGWRLSHQEKSLMLLSLDISKPNSPLSDRQLVEEACAEWEFGDAIEARPPAIRRVKIITPAEPPPLTSNVAYKFTDDAGLEFWRAGSIRLNPPATYLSIENEHARDHREGFGMVQLQGPTRSAIVTSRSGFNSLVICTSIDARKSERRLKAERFGPRIIKINDAAAFCARIAELAGAERSLVRDVVYSDAMAVKGMSPLGDIFVERNGLGDSLVSTLEYMAENHIEELIRVSEAASIFTKPAHYWRERERRFQFTFPMDVESPMTVNDQALADILEVIA